MTRFKCELRAHGWPVEEDYEYLPYNGLEAVVVDAERASVKYCYNMTDDCLIRFDHSFNEYEETFLNGWSVPEFTSKNF